MSDTKIPEHRLSTATTNKSNPVFNDHYVTFTTTIALAFKRDSLDLPTLDDSQLLRAKNSSKQRSVEAPKPRHFFHTEYSILNDNNSKTEVDIITYGAACKLFREGETRLIKTFDDAVDDKLWCIFKQHHQIKITDAVLDRIYNNKVKIKIWDNKDRCTPRARFERPKAFRFIDQNVLLTDMDNIDSDLSMGNSFDDFSEETNTIANTETTIETFKFQKRKTVFLPIDPKYLKPIISDQQDYPHSMPKEDVNPAFFKHVHKVCSSPVYEQRVAKSGGKNVNNSKTSNNNKHSIYGNEHENLSKEHARVQQTDKVISSVDLTISKKVGGRPSSAGKTPHAYAEIDLSVLFAGFRHVTSRAFINNLAIQNMSGIRDCFVTFGVDRDILSPERVRLLNPLVFRIHSLQNMPNTPLSREDLKTKCKPVYISYEFCGKKHHTHDRPHNKNIHFDDVKVILAGQMSVHSIIEQLQVKPFVFNVHDRDQVNGSSDKSSMGFKPVLFGLDPLDTDFGKLDNNSEASLSEKERSLGTHSQFSNSMSKIQDCCGEAKIELKNLLSGDCNKIMKSIPVLPSSIKSSAGILNGHYLQSGTELIVEISTAINLIGDHNKVKDLRIARPYQVVCLLFHNNSFQVVGLIKEIKQFVHKVNLEFFNIKDMSFISTVPQAKLDKSQWLSGFHFTDLTGHSVVLEGNYQVVEKIVENFKEQFYSVPCDVLMDSSLYFSSRQYDHNPDLYTTKLHKSMSNILSNPKMYVEVKKPLTQAILNLWTLRTCKTLRETLKTNSMPTKCQLLLLEQKMAIPINDFGLLTGNDEDNPFGIDDQTMEYDLIDLNIKSEKPFKTSRAWTPLDHSNPKFMKAKQKYKFIDIITDNKRTISNISEIVHNQRMNAPLTVFNQHDNESMKMLVQKKRELTKDRLNNRLEEANLELKEPVSPC